MRTSSFIISIFLHVALVATLVVVSASRPSASEPAELEEIAFVEILDDASPSLPSESSPRPEPPPIPEPPPPEEPPLPADSPLAVPPPPAREFPPEPQAAILPKEPQPVVEPPPESPQAVTPPEDASSPSAESSRVVSLPAAVNRIAPKYPRSARRKGHEGRVLVETEIGVAGEVRRVDVVESSGFPELDAAAVEAIRHAEFAPAKDGDVPVVGIMRLPIEFHLK